MKVFVNDKDFLVIKLNAEEAKSAGMGIPEGCICMHCNGLFTDNIYYVAALNDTLCEECYKEWIKDAKYYPDDFLYESRNFRHYLKKLSQYEQ